MMLLVLSVSEKRNTHSSMGRYSKKFLKRKFTWSRGQVGSGLTRGIFRRKLINYQEF